MPYTYRILKNIVLTCLQTTRLKPRMKVELLDPTSRVPCTLGLVCGVVGMTFHRAPVTLGTCVVVVSTIKKGSIKLPFPTSTQAKMKGMENAVVLWHDKDMVVCK
jgi:hypothetical protein